MKYISTRGGEEVTSAVAVIDGMASDGGLFVPEEFPALDYKDLLNLDYAARCDVVLKKYFDFDVTGVAREAYDGFECDDPAPLVKLDENIFILELWHGRTCAFKDMALSVLPRLLVKAKKAEKQNNETLILVATSGDTGKAALDGFKDVEGVKACAFYPTDGVSKVQKLAMQTQEGKNVCAVGIYGNFDDAQSAVKQAFADEVLNEILADNGVKLSSANSINIGRLVPQIAYYFSAYCDMINAGVIKDGDRIDFVVPTGNFGNILAGYYAKNMGLPINKLVCASNKNNVLTDFLTNGVYDVKRQFYKTSSPSMDIIISSNLERLIFELSGRDGKVTARRMAELKPDGKSSMEYKITAQEFEKMKETFSCGYADEDDTKQAVCDTFDEYGYLIDPHTAVAYSVANRRGFTRPTVILSTANPYKFAPAVLGALEDKDEGEANPKMLDRLCDLTAMEIPPALYNVFDAKVRFDEVITVDQILDYIGAHYGKN